MNEERVSAKAMLAMRGAASFIANMISVGGCASAGFAETGALVPPTSVGGAPLRKYTIRDAVQNWNKEQVDYFKK
jgi:hypothetical protein